MRYPAEIEIYATLQEVEAIWFAVISGGNVMKNLQDKMETVLAELKETIIELINMDGLDNAKILMEQYVKLAAQHEDRYILEAMILEAEDKMEETEQILREGLAIHPLSFDLLHNLGLIFAQKTEYLEAYYLYMKAKYVADSEEQINKIGGALGGLVKHFSGAESIVDGEIVTLLKIGDTKLGFQVDNDQLLQRKGLLYTVINYIDLATASILRQTRGRFFVWE